MTREAETRATTGDFEVLIFSYNRGRHLRNCFDSVRRELPPCRVTIIDDGSDEPSTVTTLGELESSGVRVIREKQFGSLNFSEYVDLSAEERKGLRYGGLYSNLRRALDQVAEAPLTLVLEDDVQVVRHVGDAEIRGIRDFMIEDARSPFLGVHVLIQMSALEANSRYRRTDDRLATYEPVDPDPESAGFAPVGLYCIPRLRSSGWHVGTSEATTSASAYQAFGSRHLYASPFVAVLPAPPGSRFRDRTWVSRIWSARRTGLYPVRLRGGAETLIEGGSGPVTDEQVIADGFDGPRPWPYRYLEGAPDVVRRLDGIEQSLRARARGIS